MSSIGKYILKDGSIVDALPKVKKSLGVIFDETPNDYLILPFSDIDCHRTYDLQEIIDIAESYNQEHGNRYLQWSVPSLKDWNTIISNLGKTLPQGREELSANDRMSEWMEFDATIAAENLKKYGLTAKSYYWSCNTEYDDEVYFLDLEAGTIEAFSVWDDGEPYDYTLRLVGHVIKNRHGIGWCQQARDGKGIGI